MNIDPNSVLRTRDMNQVQRDIIALVYKRIKSTPKSNEWSDFNEIIIYSGRKFRVEMTYRFNDFFLEIQKFSHKEAEKEVKRRYIHYSKGER